MLEFRTWRDIRRNLQNRICFFFAVCLHFCSTPSSSCGLAMWKSFNYLKFQYVSLSQCLCVLSLSVFSCPLYFLAYLNIYMCVHGQLGGGTCHSLEWFHIIHSNLVLTKRNQCPAKAVKKLQPKANLPQLMGKCNYICSFLQVIPVQTFESILFFLFLSNVQFSTQ